MTAKEFLSQAWHIDVRIEAKSAEYMRLRDKLEAGRSANYSGMPRGGSGDWTDAVDTVIEMERTINRDIMKLCSIKRQVNEAIDAVEDLQLRTVLELRYRSYMSWDEIAEKLGYELRNVFRVHGKALLKVRVPKDYTDVTVETHKRSNVYIKKGSENDGKGVRDIGRPSGNRRQQVS